MGKIEKIMHSCRYWKNVAKSTRKNGECFSHYYDDHSDQEVDLKPDFKNKFCDKNYNGKHFFGGVKLAIFSY